MRRGRRRIRRRDGRSTTSLRPFLADADLRTKPAAGYTLPTPLATQRRRRRRYRSCCAPIVRWARVYAASRRGQGVRDDRLSDHAGYGAAEPGGAQPFLMQAITPAISYRNPYLSGLENDVVRGVAGGGDGQLWHAPVAAERRTTAVAALTAPGGCTMRRAPSCGGWARR